MCCQDLPWNSNSRTWESNNDLLYSSDISKKIFTRRIWWTSAIIGWNRKKKLIHFGVPYPTPVSVNYSCLSFYLFQSKFLKVLWNLKCLQPFSPPKTFGGQFCLTSQPSHTCHSFFLPISISTYNVMQNIITEKISRRQLSWNHAMWLIDGLESLAQTGTVNSCIFECIKHVHFAT